MCGGVMDDLPSIKEALAHAHEVPVADRGTPWHRWVEALERQAEQLRESP